MIVPLVPMTPIFPFLVDFTAVRAPGPITPRTGRAISCLTASIPKEEAELQAIMIIFTP